MCWANAAFAVTTMAASTATDTKTDLLIFMIVSPNQHSTLGTQMKTDLSLAELRALVEVLDEHVDRNFPGVDPPRLLREIQQKLDTIITSHREEIQTVIKSARTKKAGKK